MSELSFSFYCSLFFGTTVDTCNKAFRRWWGEKAHLDRSSFSLSCLVLPHFSQPVRLSAIFHNPQCLFSFPYNYLSFGLSWSVSPFSPITLHQIYLTESLSDSALAWIPLHFIYDRNKGQCICILFLAIWQKIYPNNKCLCQKTEIIL